MLENHIDWAISIEAPVKWRTFNDYNIGQVILECIVYSLCKYREIEGRKDLGDNFWNCGKTKEIKNRVLHL